MKSSAARRCVRLAAMLSIVGATASCGIEKQTAPALAGPSEFARSITLIADPNIVARDGESQARITVIARDSNAAPIARLPIGLSVNPINGGTLSVSQVETDAAGQAVFTFTAPSVDTVVTSATIVATPFGGDFNSASTRTISVGLVAPAAATPSFTVSPESPVRFQLVTFNATGTTFAGTACNGACTYNWRFGSEATATGQIVTHRFQQEMTYIVVLEVTAPSGIVTRTQQIVVVGAPTAPTAAFTFSPSDPIIGQTVFFNASGSIGANGLEIVSYEWNFGNGQTATGATPSTTFGSENEFVVTLTVTDSAGQRATTTRTVGVAAP